MQIAGFVPTTMVDYPGKLACTVFVRGCNLRCPYCQNGSLVLRSEDGAYEGDVRLRCSQAGGTVKVTVK